MTTPSRQIEQQGPSGLPELYKYGFAVAKRAVQEDNAKQWTTAWGLYEDAAHTVLQLLQHERDPKKIALLHLKWDEYSQRAEELSRLVRVSRVDELQTDGIEQVTCDTDNRFEADAAQIPLEIEKAGSQEKDDITNRERSDLSGSQIASPQGHLAPSEIEVLKRSSIINGRLYLPWIAMDDKERFSFDVPFKDPQGPLVLSMMQRAAFAEWKRVSEIFSEHRMVRSMCAGAIVQDLVTDCSFVASLCVSSEYERKFKKQLITSRIYPRNKSGQPVYNPSGKYMVKLTWNGVPRKVVVDDYLPVGKDGRLLCTFSLNREIWPSIVEKAYLKLQGGYGFPGSNSGIDLHALTGWIPEHIFIKDGSLPSMSIFRRLQDGYQAGHALITVATSSLRENNIEQFGLIAGHAYAVLDVRIVQVGDTPYNLLQIKNPWRSMQRESKIFTQDPYLRQKIAQALAASGLEVDEKTDGIFWIDFQSICDWFDTIHINWNPHMWEHRFTLHAAWPVSGPRKDIFNFGSNPQFSLQVDVSNENSTAVWILLTKHITVTEENSDYITLHLYGDSGGERVFYSGEPMLRGVYVNSPHVLVRFKSPKGSAKYTIVLSQHEKSSRTLQYTLTVYAMSPFRIQEIQDTYPYSTQVVGHWTSTTAGGSLNHPTFQLNPRYKLVALKETRIFITLEAPKEYPVNVKLIRDDVPLITVTKETIALNSGDYRNGFCYVKGNDIQAGVYTVVPSTFQPGQIGTFILTVQSTEQLSFS